MFPTLAHQLAFADGDESQLNQIIGDAIIKSPDIDRAAAFEQFRTLIAAPLDEFCAKTQSAKKILIVLDALDECQGIGSKHILAHLRDHTYHNAPRVRILLTSRPEYYSSNKVDDQPHVVEHDLHMDDESAQEDIAWFLKEKLPLILNKLKTSVEDWPREEDIQTLADMSGCLFLFADTALRFIGDDEVVDPQQQMNILLGMDQVPVNPYSSLDRLYREVLENAITRDRQDIFLRFRRVVGCIILSQETLPVSAIAKIADYSAGQVMAALSRLQSVIRCSSPPGTTGQQNSDLLPHVYHPSFSDFLVDLERCSNRNFTIIKLEMHGFIILRCFKLMEPVLRRNILDLYETSIPNQSIPDLEAKVKSHITPEAAYACQFWLSHLLESGMDEDILEALRDFLSKRFLWWCEALSLLGSARDRQDSLLATVAFALQTAWERMVSNSREL